MSTLRSKFESKFKERSKVSKKDTASAENIARQRQSRAAAINTRRVVATGYSPLKEEMKQSKPATRVLNAVEDRKALLMKWKQEKETLKSKELEEKKKKGWNVKEGVTSKNKITKTQSQETKITRSVGRPPKVTDNQKTTTKKIFDFKQPTKTVVPKDHSNKEEAIKVTRTSRNADSKQVETKRVTRSMQSKPDPVRQVKKVVKATEQTSAAVKKVATSEVVKRGRGRPPTKQLLEDKKIIKIDEKAFDLSDDNQQALNKSHITPSRNANTESSVVKRRQTMTPVTNNVVNFDVPSSKKHNKINSDDDVIYVNEPANTRNNIVAKKPIRSDRRRTIGVLFPTCSTPKARSSEDIKEVALIATESRKRGRPPKLTQSETSFRQQIPKELNMEIDIQSSFSTDAVLGSVGRKRGRPPKNTRRRTVAVGNVATPKFFREGVKRSRRSLEPILRSFGGGEVGEDVLVVSSTLNKKNVIENDNQILVVSITNETNEGHDNDAISPKPTPRRRGRKSNVNSFNHGDVVANGDDHILYSLAEEDEDEVANRHENDGRKEAVDIDEDDSILYSHKEESSEEEKESLMKEDEKNENCVTPSTGVRKRGRPPKILNQSAMAQLESTPIRSAESNFKTPLPKENIKNKRYSLSVEALKSDPKKCLKSFILRNLSPAESIEVLRHSPMIEMTRRKPHFNIKEIEDAAEERCRFSDLMDKEREHLAEGCGVWKKCLEEEKDISEEVQGQIRVAVGKAELLMKERFNQFNELIKDHLTKRSEKPVTEEDLQGFWDMVLCQVADVDSMLDNLKKLKENNWVQQVVQTKASPPKKKTTNVSSKPVVIRGVSKFAQFRKKLLENQNADSTEKLIKKQTIITDDVINVDNLALVEESVNNLDNVVMDSNEITSNDVGNTKCFDGGFFVVKSPLQIAVLGSPRTSTGRKSMATPASDKSKKTPFFLKDHSYFAKKKRDSVVQKISFDDSSMMADADQSNHESPNSVMSQVRRRSFQVEAKGNRRSIRYNGSDSLNESISQYLKPSDMSWFESPLHHPRVTPSPACIAGDLISFSPSTPIAKNTKPSLRKSVLIKSSRRTSHLE